MVIARPQESTRRVWNAFEARRKVKPNSFLWESIWLRDTTQTATFSLTQSFKAVPGIQDRYSLPQRRTTNTICSCRDGHASDEHIDHRILELAVLDFLAKEKAINPETTFLHIPISSPIMMQTGELAAACPLETASRTRPSSREYGGRSPSWTQKSCLTSRSSCRASSCQGPV
jgi:hypothetical protein